MILSVIHRPFNVITEERDEKRFEAPLHSFCFCGGGKGELSLYFPNAGTEGLLARLSRCFELFESSDTSILRGNDPSAVNSGIPVDCWRLIVGGDEGAITLGSPEQVF